MGLFNSKNIYTTIIFIIIGLALFSYVIELILFQLTGKLLSRRAFYKVLTPTKEPYTSNFVPVEDVIVPTQASSSNRLNNAIGTRNASLVVPGAGEVVIPSDWTMSRTLPTEYDGTYWPSGSIQPDFIYPGSDPKRPLRSQQWNAAYTRPL
jgi:hypothetical protein